MNRFAHEESAEYSVFGVRATIAVLALVAACVFGPGTANASTSHIVASSTRSQTVSGISGSKIVFLRMSNAQWDVYVYDTSKKSTKRLTNDTYDQGYPAISGSNVVYTDSRHGNEDVYCYNLSTNTEKRLTTHSSNQNSPSISGSKVVYADERHISTDIYCYDLDTNEKKLLTTGLGSYYEPVIRGNTVVYTGGLYYDGYDDPFFGKTFVFKYDLATGLRTRLARLEGGGGRPSFYGKRVVYSDERGGNWDIYCYDLERITETRLTTSEGTEMYPMIYGTDVVYEYESASGASNYVYYYNLLTGKKYRLTKASGHQSGPYIYKTKVVYSAHSSGSGTFRIFRTKLPPSVGTPDAPETMRDDTLYTVSGFLRPRHTAGTKPVRIYKWKKLASGKWDSRGYVTATASDYSVYSHYSKKMSFSSPGKWRVRALHPEDSKHRKRWSAKYDYVTVTN